MLTTTTQALAAIKQRGGFLTEGDLEVLSKDDATRLTPILVRCGAGRFTAPAQDVKLFVQIITMDPRETTYVRDLSLLAR